MQQTDRAEAPGSVTITSPGGASQSWQHATEVLVGVSENEPHLDVTGPLVFVGYGIENAKIGITDYAGLNVKGKIVVTLSGFPKGMPSEEAAHVSRTKNQTAQAHGAIGMLTIGTLLSNQDATLDSAYSFRR